MTIRSSVSANVSSSAADTSLPPTNTSSPATNPSLPTTNTSSPTAIAFLLGANPFTSAGLLMLVIQDITKLFYIWKPVIAVDNITALMYTKRIL